MRIMILLTALAAPAHADDEPAAEGATNAPAVGAASALPIMLGSLKKAHIDEVIKRNMAQVRHCYQRALNEEPDLAGKVTVTFVITSDGAVQSANTKASTLGDRNVEECINDQFMWFTFDKPQGGGTVTVSYPFIFVPDDRGGVYTASATVHAPPEGTRTGTLDLAAIDAVVERRPTLRALGRCHAVGRRAAPGLWGEIVVRLVISELGSVSSAITESTTMKSSDVEACVNAVFGRLRFPAPEGEGVVVVSYPLIFPYRAGG